MGSQELGAAAGPAGQRPHQQDPIQPYPVKWAGQTWEWQPEPAKSLDHQASAWWWGRSEVKPGVQVSQVRIKSGGGNWGQAQPTNGCVGPSGGAVWGDVSGRSGSGSAGFTGRHRQGCDGTGDKHTSSVTEAETKGPGPSLNGAPTLMGRACWWRPQFRLVRVIKAY